MEKIEFYECPFCGGTDLEFCAFSISPDCFVRCKGCNASIELEVPWNDMNEKEHDIACWEALQKAWNKRA